MKKERPVPVWVCSDFRSLLKVESAKQGMSIIDLSKRIVINNKSSNDQEFDGVTNVKRKPFTFKI